MVNKPDIKDKPTLTIDKLREISDADNCNFVLYVGRKRLIKRKQFDEYIAKSFSI